MGIRWEEMREVGGLDSGVELEGGFVGELWGVYLGHRQVGVVHVCGG